MPRLLSVGSELSLSWEDKDFSYIIRGSNPAPTIDNQWLKDAQFFVLVYDTIGHQTVPFSWKFDPDEEKGTRKKEKVTMKNN